MGKCITSRKKVKHMKYMMLHITNWEKIKLHHYIYVTLHESESLVTIPALIFTNV